MPKKIYERGPISQLLKSSFGFTASLVCLALLGDWAIQEFAPVSAGLAHDHIVSLWASFYNYVKGTWADGDDSKTAFLIIVVCTQFYHITTFWAHCLSLSLLDLFPQYFPWAHQWKIQNHDEAVDTKKLVWTALTCLFNQIAVNGPLAYVTYSITKAANMSALPEDIPTFRTLIIDLSVFAIVEEIGFYYGHRMMHWPFFYKHFHKQHHEWTAPVSFVAIYADPIEHITSNLLPLMAGPWLMGSHVVSYWLWLFIAVFVTIQVHSGYHFPFLPSSGECKRGAR